MSRPIATQEPSGKCLPLTGPQEAAVAKLAYTAGQPGAIALLCGPAGVGKTTVLRAMAADGLPKSQTIRLMPWADIRADRGDLAASRMRAAASDDDSFPHVLLIDDAHRAVAAELVEFVEWCRRRHDGIAIVLAGAVRLRATVPTFTLAESRRVFGPTLAFNAAEADGEAVIRTIHEIAGGVPAIAVRLAEMLAMLAAADPRRDLTPDDVEAIHRRLSLSAA